MKSIIHTLKPEETYRLGARLAPHLFPGSVVALSGDLGAGKTTLTAGIAHGLGVVEHIISPTFNIMRIYRRGRLDLYHIDAYRLEDGNADIGLEEFIDGTGVSVIEWPQYVSSFLPKNVLRINLFDEGPLTRRIEMATEEDRFAAFFDALAEGAL